MSGRTAYRFFNNFNFASGSFCQYRPAKEIGAHLLARHTLQLNHRTNYLSDIGYLYEPIGDTLYFGYSNDTAKRLTAVWVTLAGWGAAFNRAGASY